MNTYLTKCPGTGQPLVATVIMGKVFAECVCCSRKYPKLEVGNVAPRHYRGTQAHG